MVQSGSRQGWLWAGALAIVLAVLLHESLLGGKGLVPTDGILQHAPWAKGETAGNSLLGDQFLTFVPQHEFVHQEILKGDFPLWNPHLDCGMPNLGSIQGALLFPIQLLLSPFNPFYTAGPAAFLKLYLAGLFTMWYLRRLGASPPAAFLSGLVFSLSSFMIVWLGHPHVNSAVWLPLLFYLVEKMRDAGDESIAAALRPTTTLAVAFALVFLGGHPPTAVHITFAAVIYFAFRLGGRDRGHRLRNFSLLAGSLAAGFLLAAPQLLPYLEYHFASSSDAASDNLHRAANHLTSGSFIHFLLPYFWGSPATGFEGLPDALGLGKLANFNERTGYAGIVPLFLGICAIIWRRCQLTRFHLLFVIVALAIIYGLSPLPDIMNALPLFNKINHNRLLLLVGFSVAVLAGLGWDTLQRLENRHRFWTVIGFCATVIAAVAWIANLAAPQYQSMDMAQRAFLGRQLLILALGLVAAGLAAWRPAQRLHWVPAAAGLGWTIVDLLWFGMGYNPAISRDKYYPETGAIAWLKKDPSVFRIIGGGSTLMPNSAAVFGLDDVRGCDFMGVRRYEELITGTAGLAFFYSYVPTLPESFPALNAKYLLLPKEAAANYPGFELAYSDEILIYRFKAWRERALVVFDYEVEHNPSAILTRLRSGQFDPSRKLLLEETPGEKVPPPETGSPAPDKETSARILSYRPEEVVVQASLPRPGFLLLLDTWFPGWAATINGQPARIYRADYNFRAVVLPAGKSIVRFTYRPNSFLLGLALCALSAAGLGATWFWSRKKTPRSP